MSTDPARKLRRRNAAAFGAAVLFHVVLILSLFATASGVVSRGGPEDWDQGDAILVSLSGMEGAKAGGGGGTNTASTDADSLARMMARLRTEDSELTTSDKQVERPRGDLSKLFDALGQVGGTGKKGGGRDSAGRSAERGQQAQTASASAKGDPSDDISSGDLWGQIEPCWSRLPQRSAVPVALEVVLNDQGRLAVPPKIIRAPGAAPDEARLVAEARALTAIAACLPYHKVALPGSKRTYRLTFQPSKGG